MKLLFITHDAILARAYKARLAREEPNGFAHLPGVLLAEHGDVQRRARL